MPNWNDKVEKAKTGKEIVARKSVFRLITIKMNRKKIILMFHTKNITEKMQSNRDGSGERPSLGAFIAP